MPLFTVSKDCGAPSIDVPELGLWGVKPGDEFELPEAPNTDLIVPVKSKPAPKAEADQPKEADK